VVGKEAVVANDKVKAEHVKVADCTGCVTLLVRNEQCDRVPAVGRLVTLRNCKVSVQNGGMLLFADKWSSIEPATDVLPGEANVSRNFSETEYKRVAS
jgi:hypothetical protein